jgi:hypothetical protein
MLWGRFPSMAITQEHLAAILFVVAMVGIALGMLLALFLLFRDEQQGIKKPAKNFLLSNWK